jgi:DNA-binding transcriptional MerR regulator
MAPNGDLPLFGGSLSTAAAPHRSIGEVLALLKDEFPDITISKIRFLESQGLLDPERTPSGYRRFYDKDVERLRWILRQQRENFLPLKVIRGRLAEGLDRVEAEGSAGASSETEASPRPSAPKHAKDVTDAKDAPTGEGDTEPASAPAATPGAHAPAEAPAAPGTHVADTPVSAGAPAPEVSPAARGARAPTAPEPSRGPASGEGATSGAEAHSRRVLPEPAIFSHRASNEPPRPVFGDVSPTSVSLTADELAAAAGISTSDVADLERFGLIDHRSLGSTAVYDDEALLVARAAAVFLSHGIQPRHLRMYKVAADRESGVFEQVVLPLVHQRSPEARRRAVEVVDELARLGEVLHAAMLRRALKNLA